MKSFSYKKTLQSTDDILSLVMLVKVNNIDIDKNKVRVSKLDIDDYGSVIALKELELRIPANDNFIIRTLQNSSYAAIFTEGDTDDNNSTIILANGITIEELNKEKSKTIDKVVRLSHKDFLYLPLYVIWHIRVFNYLV